MRLKRKREADYDEFDDFEDDGYEGQDPIDGFEPEDDFGADGFDDGFYGDGGSAPLEKHNDLLKELTNFAPFLKEKVNGWLGTTWNEEKQTYTKHKNIRAIMNIQCAAWCISTLQTYARGNNIITDIGKEEYKYMMNDIIDYIWFNIGTRMEEFGIEEEGDMLRICNEMEHASALVLMGAGDGKYNKFLGTVTTRHESVSPEGQPNHGGPMSQMGGRPQGDKNSWNRIKKVFFGI